MPESKRDLTILVMGGTIAAEKKGTYASGTDGRRKRMTVTVPKRGKIKEIVDHEVYKQPDYYNDIEVIDSKPFIDSSEARCETIEQVLAAVRAQLIASTNDVILCYGTDGAALLTQALSEGVEPGLLKDRSLLVTVAQHAFPKRPEQAVGRIHNEGSDAADNLSNAIYLATCEQIHQRIALVVKGAALPPRGLRKSNTESLIPFDSRYGVMRSADTDAVPNRWGEWQQRQNFHMPAGIPGSAIHLSPGVETIGLDAITNYTNLQVFLEAGVRAGTLNGLILQAPGSRNLRTNDADAAEIDSMAQDATDNGVPVVLVGDPMQPHSPSVQHAVYQGSPLLRGASNIIDANGLQTPEAKVIVSDALRFGKKILGHTGATLVDFVRYRVALYLEFIHNEISVNEYIDRKQQINPIGRSVPR